jgi:hypothetical protein
MQKSEDRCCLEGHVKEDQVHTLALEQLQACGKAICHADFEGSTLSAYVVQHSRESSRASPGSVLRSEIT